MENNKISFAFKLILSFPFVGILWTWVIYFISDTNSLNFNIAYWIGGLGVSVGLLCLVSKSIYRVVFYLWCKIISVLDTAITWISLPVFYYLIFSPFALLIRLTGKASMNQPCKNKSTYWKYSEQPSSEKQYLRQF